MPAQLPQVDVTFLVDANGLLTVSAKEQRSGQEMTVTVQPSHGLSQDEVERLVLESVEHAHDDFTRPAVDRAEEQGRRRAAAHRKRPGRRRRAVGAARAAAIEAAIAAVEGARKPATIRTDCSGARRPRAGDAAAGRADDERRRRPRRSRTRRPTS